MIKKLFKKKSTRYFFWITFVAVFMFALIRFYYLLTDDIRIANMIYEIPHQQEWEIPPLTSEEKLAMEPILTQKFYYISKGTQSYAFGSEDGQYVLKFFKFKHLKPNWIIDHLPPFSPFIDYRNKQSARKQKKLFGAFTGYLLAYQVDRDESGLLFIHLNKTTDLQRKVTLIDKLGFEHEADLDEMVFFIQKKVVTMRQRMNKQMKQGDISSVKQDIRKVFDLYISEYKKGIYDRDHGVMHNMGFFGDQPIHLDVGMLTRKEAMKQPGEMRKDLALVARKLKIWFNTNYPDAASEILQDMELKINELFPLDHVMENVSK